MHTTVGRLTTVMGTVLSVAAAYIVSSFDNLVGYMQLIETIFISPSPPGVFSKNHASSWFLGHARRNHGLLLFNTGCSALGLFDIQLRWRRLCTLRCGAASPG